MDHLCFDELLEEDQYDPEIQYRLGLCYLYGEGTEEDPSQARLWLERAAEQGHEQASQLLYRGEKAVSLGQIHEGNLPQWCELAEEGNVDALYRVAMYFSETDPAENREDIRRYLQEAADQGHGQACLMLGKKAMDSGAYTDAVLHLERACECNIPEAALLLSQCYFQELGVDTDTQKADELLMRSAAWGDVEWKIDVAARYEVGFQISRSHGRALSLVAAAEKAGAENAMSQFYMFTENYRSRLEGQKRYLENLEREALAKREAERQRQAALERETLAKQEAERQRQAALEREARAKLDQERLHREAQARWEQEQRRQKNARFLKKYGNLWGAFGLLLLQISVWFALAFIVARIQQKSIYAVKPFHTANVFFPVMLLIGADNLFYDVLTLHSAWNDQTPTLLTLRRKLMPFFYRVIIPVLAILPLVIDGTIHKGTIVAIELSAYLLITRLLGKLFSNLKHKAGKNRG